MKRTFKNSKYKDDYYNLNKDISIVNAGQFSEYVSGNTLLLMLLGDIELNKDETFRLSSDAPRKHWEYCH